MRTNEITREQISALIDGELLSQQVDSALAALRQSEARADWEIYHQIGDVLRSDDMAVTLSAGFAARMTARLDTEPAIVAPVATIAVGRTDADPSTKHAAKRWAVPSMVAAAAMTTVAFITTPQLMVALKDESMAKPTAIGVAPEAIERGVVLVKSASDGEVLRDPRIDDYLLAHQRFSPSVYSTAQYARPATFASDSGK